MEEQSPRSDDESKSPNFTNHSYTLFRSLRFSQTHYKLENNRRFIAVRLSKELLAPEGHFLVIPVDVQDVVLDMTEQEFRSYFSAIEDPSASDQYEEVPTPEKTSPDVTVDQTENSDESPESSSEPHFPPPPKTSAGSTTKRGVSPQLGRVLLAMHYLHRKGEDEIAGSEIQKLLSPVDAKQVSGMLSGAIKQGLVARGSALEGGRGTYYTLLVTGRHMAESLETWPYDHRGLAVPEWLRERVRS